MGASLSTPTERECPFLRSTEQSAYGRLGSEPAPAESRVVGKPATIPTGQNLCAEVLAVYRQVVRRVTDKLVALRKNFAAQAIVTRNGPVVRGADAPRRAIDQKRCSLPCAEWRVGGPRYP